MAANELAIANLARSRLGIGELLTSTDGTIANIVQAGVSKDQLVLWYAQTRDEVEQLFPWPFARAYATLVLNDAGDGEAWEHEWDFAYTYPSDCLKVRRFVSDLVAPWPWGAYALPAPHILMGRGFEYVIRQHAGVKVILTNVRESEAKIEYTKQVTTVMLFDPLFTAGLVFLLSSRLAAPLAVDASMEARALAQFQEWHRAAASTAINEETPYPRPRSGYASARGVD